MDQQPPAPRAEHAPAQPAPSPETGTAIQTSTETLPRIFNTKTVTAVVSGGVAITALVKADSKDIPKIVETLAGSSGFGFMGWILAAVFLIIGVIMITLLVKIYGKEITRISGERNDLQKMLIERNR